MLSKLISLYCLEQRKIRCFQRGSQNEAEEAMPPPLKKLIKIFRWCFTSISTVRKQTVETVGLM